MHISPKHIDGQKAHEKMLNIANYSVQFSPSVVSDSLRPHGLQHSRPPCPSPTSTNLLKLMSIELVMPSNHLLLCRPLLPSVFPSIRVSSSESALRIRWPKYWSFSFSISSFSEYSGLISFRIDWSPYHPRNSQESSPALRRNCNIKCRIST